MADIAAWAVVITCLAALYLTPSMVAYARAVPGTSSIIILNVMTGWTVAGWGYALARALRCEPAPAAVPDPLPGPVQWHAPLAGGRLPPPGRAGTPPPLQPALVGTRQTPAARSRGNAR